MASEAEFLWLAEQEVSRRLKNRAPLRPQQRKVLSSLIQGKNVFAGLPTGYGKSLCYWAPAAAWGWRVWVISPLVSLIHDQTAASEELGLRAAGWYGGMGAERRKQIRDRMERGEVDIVFLSPERLVSWWEEGFVDKLRQLGLGPDLLALDEMHCFEDWRGFRVGFRDAFEPIRRLVERGVVLLGLSASLARPEADAWMSELCSDYLQIGSGLGRDNLKLKVIPLESEAERWLSLVSSLKGLKPGDSVLVYCATRDEVDEVTRWLCSVGLPASAYHAGLPASLRTARSRAFRLGQLPIVCATTAFGMGIDYPRVLRVIHFSAPYSLEAYWQEVGRAGRDGRVAESIVLWRRSEITRARGMNVAEKEKFSALWLAWAEGGCRKQAIGTRLGITEEECGQCDRCVHKGKAEKAWWVSEEARLKDWVKEKIFGVPENS